MMKLNVFRFLEYSIQLVLMVYLCLSLDLIFPFCCEEGGSAFFLLCSASLLTFIHHEGLESFFGRN